MSHLISILEHAGSQEGPQDVAHRGAGTPQAEHEATAGGRHHEVQLEFFYK